MFEWLLSPEALVALFTLTALEIVLGIDNIILISILVAKLPPKQRQPGRIIGLSLAMGTRILLLLTLSWMMHLIEPLFELFGKGVSGRDLILFFGGLFLIVKSTNEIREAMTPHTEEKHHEISKKVSFIGVLIQIALLEGDHEKAEQYASIRSVKSFLSLKMADMQIMQAWYQFLVKKDMEQTDKAIKIARQRDKKSQDYHICLTFFIFAFLFS